MFKKIKRNNPGNKTIRFTISLMLASLALLMNCARSPTITTIPDYVLTPSEDLGTINPTIQFVYPGSLQTLDVPDPYLTDVNPSNANFVVVFSHLMDNATPTIPMKFVFSIYEDSTLLPVSIYPATSSKTFIINPAVNEYKENTEYTLRIYKYAYVIGSSTRILSFENLVEPPANSLSPVNPYYVEYKFRTGPSGIHDVIKPYLFSSIPTDGEVNVDPNTYTSSTPFQLIFSDNIIPMINPMTVNEFTIQLYNTTLSTSSAISVIFDYNDNDFKTIYVTPVDTLLYGDQYQLKVSAGDSIKDFQGNSVTETVVTFTVMP